jgi:hypothetical protein
MKEEIMAKTEKHTEVRFPNRVTFEQTFECFSGCHKMTVETEYLDKEDVLPITFIVIEEQHQKKNKHMEIILNVDAAKALRTFLENALFD